MRSVIPGVLGAWSDQMPDYGTCRASTPMPWRNAAPMTRANAGGGRCRAQPGRFVGDPFSRPRSRNAGPLYEGVDGWTHARAMASKNPVKAHVSWHAALFMLSQGENKRALDLYDKALCSVNSEQYVDVSNRGRAAQAHRDERHRRRRPLAGFGRAFGEAHPRPHAALPRRAFQSGACRNGNSEVALKHIESDGGVFGAGQGWRVEATRDV